MRQINGVVFESDVLDQAKMQEVADVTRRFYEIEPIEIQLKNVRAGRARYRTFKITIPTWIQKKPLEYQIAYVVHEVAHFKAINHGHGYIFKKWEDIGLKQWGISIDRAKAYAKRVYANGDCIYDRNQDRRKPEKRFEGRTPMRLSLKAMFKKVLDETSFPIEKEKFLEELNKFRAGKGTQATMNSYLSWVKRKRNPFGCNLIEQNGMLDKEEW